MPSKLKKAIAAMKDQTSISLAKVGGAESSNLEVAILKATTHEEVPIDERYVTHILQLVSSNRSYAAASARVIGRRIGRTKTWVVAVKALILVLRVFQDGDPHFPKEVLHAMKRGYKILNLHSFRDDSSTSCPWDFTAFVRTVALYLDERLECFVTGKLQRRTSYSRSGSKNGYSRQNEPIVRDMKPRVLLDKIVHWQKLLDRAIATQPTGAARPNQLIQTCLYAIVEETFDLYRDISDGLTLLLDSFFHLQYKNCVRAYETCVKASKQFDELGSFYDLCKRIGVGRISEYPSIQKVSEELLDTLQEFLKDKSFFPGTNGQSTPSGSSANGLPPRSPNSKTVSVRRSEYSQSQGKSLEDLIGADGGFSPDRHSDPGRENPPQLEDRCSSANDNASVHSEPPYHREISSGMDLLSLEDPSPPSNEFKGQAQDQTWTSGNGWELVLFETVSNQPSTQVSNHVKHDSIASNNNGFEMDLFSNFSAPADSSSSSMPIKHNYNPFLQDTDDFNGVDNGIHQQHQVDLYDPTQGSNFNSSTNVGSFSQHNRSISTSFLEDFNVAGPPTYNHTNSNGHHVRFASADLSASSTFLDAIAINNNANNASFSRGGFPPTFQANHHNTTKDGTDHISRGGGLTTTFHTEYGFSNGNATQQHQVDLFDDLTQGSNNFGSKTNVGSFNQHNRSISTSFLEDINVAGPPTYNHPNSNNHHARFASIDLGSFAAFPGDFNNYANNTGVSDRPIIHHVRYGSNFRATPSFPDAFDNFGGYNNGTVPPSFSTDSRDINPNAMSSIVPFGQVGSNDFFSSGPRFESAPTFRATTLDTDQHQQSSGLWNEDDPFGSISTTRHSTDQQKMNESLDKQNFLQQQIWLQNQNNIMARYMT